MDKIGLVFIIRFVNSEEEQMHLCVILLYNSELKLFHVSKVVIPTCSLIRKLLVKPKISLCGLKDEKQTRPDALLVFSHWSLCSLIVTKEK